MRVCQFPGLGKLGAPFRRALEASAARLGTDPNFLAAVMQAESGFDPQATNPHAGAVGLIQFMPFVCRAYGFAPADVKALGAIGQLKLVERFYRPYLPLRSAGETYMSTFLPAFRHEPGTVVLGRRDDPGLVTTSDGKTYGLSYAKIYAQNYGFDQRKRGVITVSDVRAIAERNYQAALASGPYPEDALRFAVEKVGGAIRRLARWIT